MSSYALQVGMLFDPLIDDEKEVLKIYKNASKLLFEGKTVMSWSGEGDNASLQWTLPIDYVRSECRYFLKRVNPDRYGYLVNAARQIRF